MLQRALRVAVASLAAVLTLGLAACGDDDSSGGEASAAADGGPKLAVEAARADVEKARAAVAEFDGPQESPGPVPKRKSVAVIYPVAVPLPLRASESVKEAAEAVGWSARLIDGRGSPEGYVNALNQAVSSGADAIVLVAMPVPLLREQIVKAEEKGIPVVGVLPALPKVDSPPSEFGLFDYASANHDEEGYLMGKWVVQDAPDGAQAIRLTSPEFPDLTRQSDQFAKALEDAGSGYQVVETIQSPVTDSQGGEGAQKLAAVLRANPDVKYAFVLFTNTFLDAVKLSGRDDVIGLSADVDTWVPAVRESAGLVLVGPDTLTYGWYAVDALIRAFNGKEPVGTYDLSSQLVDSANAGDVKGDSIAVDYDYRAEWRSLWGLGE